MVCCTLSMLRPSSPHLSSSDQMVVMGPSKIVRNTSTGWSVFIAYISKQTKRGSNKRNKDIHLKDLTRSIQAHRPHSRWPISQFSLEAYLQYTLSLPNDNHACFIEHFSSWNIILNLLRSGLLCRFAPMESRISPPCSLYVNVMMLLRLSIFAKNSN